MLDYVPQGERAAYYARARVLINTSTTEGLPVTFIVAACQGTPILTSNLDPAGFFERYGHGLVLGEPRHIATKIEELFDNELEIIELSARARRYFEEVHYLGRNLPRLVGFPLT